MTACFHLFINSQSALEEMIFSYNNNIDDEGADILVNVVARHMSTVQILDVQSNPSVINNGWSSFADVLFLNSTSKLKKLRIGDFFDEEMETLINDNVMIDFVAALAGNSNLIELDVADTIISPSSLHTLVDVLYDKMSCESVCQSNHTLFEFTCSYSYLENKLLPNELVTLLDINGNKNKSAVVRTKLLLYCLSHLFARSIAFDCNSLLQRSYSDGLQWQSTTVFNLKRLPHNIPRY